LVLHADHPTAGGPYSGAALNPARVLGPSLVFHCYWSTVPVYIVAQLLGALVAALATMPLYGFGPWVAGGPAALQPEVDAQENDQAAARSHMCLPSPAICETRNSQLDQRLCFSRWCVTWPKDHGLPDCLQIWVQKSSQEVGLLPKTAPRSDAIQLTAIASSYDPTPARRGDGATPAKTIGFRDVNTCL
jgi:Major intrinsic protein